MGLAKIGGGEMRVWDRKKNKKRKMETNEISGKMSTDENEKKRFCNRQRGGKEGGIEIKKKEKEESGDGRTKKTSLMSICCIKASFHLQLTTWCG